MEKNKRLIKEGKIMKIRNNCAIIGVVMFLLTSCMGESDIVALLVWLAVSLALLYIGRAFDFQNKNSKDVQERRAEKITSCGRDKKCITDKI